MQDLNDKTSGSDLQASEWNQQPTELGNIIQAVGLGLTAFDTNQVGKAIASYISNGVFSTDSGIADAHVLTQVGAVQAPVSYVDGMRLVFRAGATNTGAATVNAYGLGVKTIKYQGVDLPAGKIVAGELIELIFDSVNDRFDLIPNLLNLFDGNTLLIQNVFPGVSLYETDATTLNRRWSISAQGEQLLFRLENDDASAFSNWLYVDRTDNSVDAIGFVNNAIHINASNNHIGFGLAAQSDAKFTFLDAGTAAGVLARFEQDDTNVYGLVLGNNTFSAIPSDGLAFFISDGGLAVLDSRGSGATMRLAINGASAIDISSSANIGINTSSPGIDLAGGTYDFPSGKILHLKGSTSVIARSVIESDAPELHLIDLNGATDSKWVRLKMDGGILSFSSMNDDGSVDSTLLELPGTQTIDDMITNVGHLNMYIDDGYQTFSYTKVSKIRSPNPLYPYYSQTAHSGTGLPECDIPYSPLFPDYGTAVNFGTATASSYSTAITAGICNSDLTSIFQFVIVRSDRVQYNTTSPNTWFDPTTPPANIDYTNIMKLRYLNGNFIIYGLAQTSGYPTIWSSSDAGDNWTQHTIASIAAANNKIFYDVVWTGTKYVAIFHNSGNTTSYIYNSSDLSTWSSVSTIDISTTGLRHAGIASNGSGEVVAFTAFDSSYTSSPPVMNLYYSINNGDTWAVKDSTIWGYKDSDIKIDALYDIYTNRYYVAYNDYKELAIITPSTYFMKIYEINPTKANNTGTWGDVAALPYSDGFFDMCIAIDPVGSSNGVLHANRIGLIIPCASGSTRIYNGYVPLPTVRIPSGTFDRY